MNDFGEEIVAAIAAQAQGLEQFYTDIARNELSKVGTEYSDNEDEYAATMAVIDSVRAHISANGASISLSFDYGESLWMDVIESGQPAPVLGGDNGIVTYPDGHQEPSRVPPQFWGKPFPEGAEPPSYIIDNIKTISSSMFYDDIQEQINNETVREIAKEYVAEQLQNALRG